MIELFDISKRYDRTEVVSNLSFKIDGGKLLAVLGPSGSGKTTLLRLIAGLERPDKGKIALNGRSVSTPEKFKPPHSRNVSMVFQNLALWPHMTIKEHLEFVINSGKTAGGEKINLILEKVNLDKFPDRYPGQLSGGECQRLAIARALISRPSFLLMDEPFSHLDFKLKKKMISLLLNLQKDSIMTVVYATHNVQEAIAMADNILMIKNGKNVFLGNTSEFSKSRFYDPEQF